MNLGASLSPQNGVSYVTAMPTDPSATSTGDGTGYYIYKLTANSNRIIVCAALTENLIGNGGTQDGAINATR